MIRRVNGRPVWLTVFAFAAALAIAMPAAAQQGMVKGTVKDDKGQPVEGAKILIESTGPSGRKMETKTDKKGEFVQVGIPSDNYTVTAEKVGVGAARMTTRVTARTAGQLNLVLAAGARTVSPEEIAKNAELKKVFEAGVAASNAGNLDEAITQFTRAAQIDAACSDCYYNMGYAYSQKKDYDKAEASYKKAVEIKPDYADAYNGLANVYNTQRKFELAAEASKKATESSGLLGAPGGGAGGGGNVNAMYNQGVILWNGGKVAEAKKQFEAVLAADPNHAESHYQLGMALVNEGNLAGAADQFQAYLKLAPSGPNAATATALLAQLKK